MGLPVAVAELVELTLLDTKFVAPHCVGLAGPFCLSKRGESNGYGRWLFFRLFREGIDFADNIPGRPARKGNGLIEPNLILYPLVAHIKTSKLRRPTRRYRPASR